MARSKYSDGRRNNRPPVKNQFKPGQSGNKNGRPPGKSRISTNEIVGRLLRVKHPIMLHGRQQMVPFIEIIFMRVFELALKGNARAIMSVMNLIENAEIVEAERIQRGPDMTEFREKIKDMTTGELRAEYLRTLDKGYSNSGRK